MTNTSLKNAVLSEKIDWIAYTQTQNFEWQFPAYIEDKWKDIAIPRFYTHAQENTQGVKRFWNIENAKQGRSVVLSGAASAILQDNQLDFLQWVNTSGRKATRIDYALDITHSKLTPALVGWHLLNGVAVTHASSRLRIGELGANADTQYIGKKTSETYTRVYDKGLEQKVDFAWLRVETIYQGERARPSLQEYCECQSTRPLIKAHIDFPKWRDWKIIMSGDVAKLDTPARETRTRAWLLSQVAKSVAREIAMDEDHTFWFTFRDRVAQELEQFERKSDIIDW